MLRYYLELAQRSCRRSKALTALVVMLMGFGVAACTLSYAVLRVAANDPIPAKSSRLFVPQVDSFGPAHNGNGQPPDQLDYTDALALLHARRALRQTLVYPTNFGVVPADPARQPFPQAGEAVTADFFAIFDVPFRYGHGWDEAADEGRTPVVVITDALNRKLFGDIDSIGRTLTLDGHDYRVSGVLGDFDPLPRYIDIASTWNGFGKLPQIYVPFARAVDQHKPPLSDYCSSTSAAPYVSDWNGFLASGCVWINGWVELPDAASAAAYQRFLVGYASEQQRLGRFAWAANVRLPNLMQVLADHRAVPRESKLSAWVALGFLIVCLVNVVGLLLARFSRPGALHRCGPRGSWRKDEEPMMRMRSPDPPDPRRPSPAQGGHRADRAAGRLDARGGEQRAVRAAHAAGACGAPDRHRRGKPVRDPQRLVGPCRQRPHRCAHASRSGDPARPARRARRIRQRGLSVGRWWRPAGRH